MYPISLELWDTYSSHLLNPLYYSIAMLPAGTFSAPSIRCWAGHVHDWSLQIDSPMLQCCYSIAVKPSMLKETMPKYLATFQQQLLALSLPCMQPHHLVNSTQAERTRHTAGAVSLQNAMLLMKSEPAARVQVTSDMLTCLLIQPSTTQTSLTQSRSCPFLNCLLGVCSHQL